MVVQTSDDYDGIERMMVDKLLTQQQCDQLIQLASVSGNSVSIVSMVTYAHTCIIIMPRCACASEVYGCVCVCLSVCRPLQLLK